VSDASIRIPGDELSVRRTTAGDLPHLLALWNDGRVMRWVGFPEGLGYDSAGVARWFERLQADPRRHHFVLLSRALGFCGELYYAVDAEHRRAGLDIKLRPEAQGGGRGTAGLSALIRQVFASEPQVDAVWTEPGDDNEAASALYTRCGLRPAPRPADMEPGQSYWELRRATGARDPAPPR
jgi:RimJ/RimL family protein N-acetyltransferase